jgi:hypothetical protein
MLRLDATALTAYSGMVTKIDPVVYLSGIQ